jgi:hypothetical protein
MTQHHARASALISQNEKNARILANKQPGMMQAVVPHFYLIVLYQQKPLPR